MKRLLLLTTFVFLIARVYGQGTQVGDSNSPIYHYNGNVGIGTSTPVSLLEVVGGSFTWKNGDNEIALTTPSAQTGIVLNVNGLGNRTRFNLINTSSSTIANRYVSLYYNDDGNNNGLVIRKGGNIGIGTTLPSHKITVGNANTTVASWATGLFEKGIAVSSSGNSSATYLYNQSQTGIHGLNAYDYGIGQYISLYLGWGGNDVLIAKDGGNVGIGTTTPDYKLDVLGTIRANEVKVASGWSDFVFEPDYDLPTLQEVENFIDQNGHLPDIPSAEEVKADGISLGEMDTKLLQKIEELTLYVIELKKSDDTKTRIIDELQREIESLKKRNR